MLKLKIVSPERIEFEGEVESVLLVNHAPIISSLDKGRVVYTLPGGEKKPLDIYGGFVEVQKNVVSLCIEINEE